MLPPFRAAILWSVLASLLAAQLFAQQNSKSAQTSPTAQQSQGEFKFQVSVNRVVVDVVVTDSNRKPVHGLTKQDFSVYEDNKPQTISSFDVYSLDSKRVYFAKLPAMPPNTFVNIATGPEKGPLYVLLLDLVNTAQSDQPYARQQLLKFISGKPEGTRFAVFVLSDGLHLVQGFTADQDLLHATLDPSHSRSHVPRIFLLGANYGKGDVVMMVDVFKQIALYLDGLSGRKNILWFSGAFPIQMFPHNDDAPDMRADVAEMLDALTRAECSVYPVEATGVEVFPAGRLTGDSVTAAPANGRPGATTSVAPGGNDAAMGLWTVGAPPTSGGGGGPLAGEMAFAGAGDSPWANHSTEDEIAALTGGHAFYGRNDLKDLLEEATETGGDYYTLTYSPSNETFDGKLRSIRVQVEGQRYHLEYRHAYLATGPGSPIMPAIYKPRKQEQNANLRRIGDSLAAYMQYGAPSARDVYFRTHVRALTEAQLASPVQMANLVSQPTYFRIRQKKYPNKPLAPIKLRTYLIEYQIIARIPQLEVAAGVYDDDGRLLNGDVEEASSENPKAPDPHAKYTYFRVQQKIDVPEGAASIRLGVRDVSTDRMGTMDIPLPLAPELSLQRKDLPFTIPCPSRIVRS